MGKPQSLGNQLTEISFIGEEIQAFSGRLVKRGAITKQDLEALVQDVNIRIVNLSKITKQLRQEYQV